MANLKAYESRYILSHEKRYASESGLHNYLGLTRAHVTTAAVMLITVILMAINISFVARVALITIIIVIELKAPPENISTFVHQN